MKKTLKSCMFAAFAAATLSLFAAPVPYDGQMEPGEYEISTFTQLTNFTMMVHYCDYAGSTIRLIADIDCQGRRFLPHTTTSEGTAPECTFRGTFDGGGHKIYNFHNKPLSPDLMIPYHWAFFDENGNELPDPTTEEGWAEYFHKYERKEVFGHWPDYYTAEETGSGNYILFDNVRDGAVIRNITFEGDSERERRGSKVYASDYAFLARNAIGENAVTIENCHYSGTIYSDDTDEGYTAAFVAHAKPADPNFADYEPGMTILTLSNCTANATIRCKAGLGYDYREIPEGSNATKIESYIGIMGGFVAKGYGVSATDCSFTGEISGIHDSGGGLAGIAIDSTFTRCSFNGTLTGELKNINQNPLWLPDGNGCGGLAGSAGNTVFRSCSSRGDIRWDLHERMNASPYSKLVNAVYSCQLRAGVAGAVGHTSGSTSFYDCSFEGSVSSIYGYYAGFAGWTTGAETFSNCTAVATLGETYLKEGIGGFAGSVSSANAKFIDCTAKVSAPYVPSGFFDAQYDKFTVRVEEREEFDEELGRYNYIIDVKQPVGTNDFIRCSVVDSSIDAAGFTRDPRLARFTDCTVSNVASRSAGFALNPTNSVFSACKVLGGSATNGFVTAALDGNRFTDCSVLGTRVVNGFVGSANPGDAAENTNEFWRCRVNAIFAAEGQGVFRGFANELKSGTLVTDCVAYGFTMDDECELYGFVGTVGTNSMILGSVGAVLPPASAAKGAGFADAILSGATVDDCYSVYGPKVAATESDTVNGVQGGFARKVAANPIRRCFALWPLPGSDSGTSHKGYGSFSGVGDDGRYEDCYRPAESAIWSVNNIEKEGIGQCTAAQFANATSETFPGFDFTDKWTAPNGAASSPYLAASTDANGNIWTHLTAGTGYGRVLVKEGNEYVEPEEAYPAGTVLTIKAVPGEGANFVKWIGEGVADPDSAETTYTVGNVGVVVATFDADLYAGQKENGTYVIVSYPQLLQFTETARDYGYAGSTIIIQNDIDCEGGGFAAGDLRKPLSFRGTFKGKGNRIFNFRNIVSEGDSYGAALFDTLGPGAVIRDLTLEGDICVENAACQKAVAFAGNAFSENINPVAPLIDNCHFTGSISNIFGAAVFVGNAYRGAYTPDGVPSVILSNCTANATVFTATNAVAGGLMLNVVDAFATGCSFDGRVEGGWTLGGLAGMAQDSTFTNCAFTGEMAGGPMAKYAETMKNGGCGGLVGFASNSVFRACSAAADIDWDYATGADGRTDASCNFVAAGGAAGVTRGASIFDGCSFNGTVQSVHGYAGGFVGWTGGSELFTNCTAVASLNPTGSVVNVALGGFAASVASREANFIDCTATPEGANSGFCDVQHKCKIGGEIGTNHFTRCTVASVVSADAGFAGSPTNAVFSSCAVRGGSAFAGFVKTSGGGCEYSDCTVTGATVRIGFVETTKGENAFNRCRAACLYGFSPDDGTGYWGFAKELNAGAVVTACAAHGAVSANNYADEEAQYGAGLFAKHIKGATLQGGCIGAVMQTMAVAVDKRIALLVDDEASVNDTWSLFEDDVPADVTSATTQSGRYWTHAVVVAGEGTILVDDKSPLASYEKNSVHTIRAVPADGYEFSHWVGVGYGDADSTETTYTTGNIGAIAAAFAKKVGTPEELLAVSGNPTVPYVITGDIDLSGALPEVVNKPLLGDLKSRFLGRGHTISGLRFNDKTGGAITKTCAALFGRIKSGTQLRDLTVDVSASNSWALVSGLALTIEENTLVSNCTVNVDFRSVNCDVSKTVEYYGIASNVVGSAVTVMDCTVTGTMEASTRAAGFFGGVSLRSGEIARCASFCDVYATAPSGVASGFANSLAAGDGYGARVLVREIVTSGTIYGSDTGAGIAASVSIAHNDAMVRDMYSTAEVRAYTGYGVAAGIARTLYTPASGPSISNVWFGGTARAGLHKNYGFAETINSVTLVNCAFIDVPGVDMQWTTGAESIDIPFVSRLSSESWAGYDLDGVWSMTEAQTTPYFAWSLDNGGFRILATRSRGTTITRPAFAAPGASVAVTAGTTPSSDAFFVRWDGAAAYADGEATSTTFPADNHRTASCIWGRNISTPAQLQAVTEDLSGIYHVVADIDMADFDFTTIGGVRYALIAYSGNYDYYYNAYYPFFGIFDGQGHAISNVVARKSFSPHNKSGMPGTFGGLFARLQEADVKDIRLVGPQIISFEHGGALAGEVVSSKVSGCSALGASVDGNESGSSSGYTGGLVGRTANSEILRSFAAGYVSGVKAGGFAGFVNNCTVRECFASGAVKATNAESGGFAGYIGGEAAIEDSYTVSEVEGGSGFAGTVGGSDVRIERCYSAGIAERASSGGSVGGFIGVSTGAPAVTDCVRLHYDIEEKRGIRDVGSADHANIVALTADEMRSVTNFTAFLEKENTPWAQVNGATHPYFPWCLDENGQMPLVTMTIARNALAAPAVNFASLFGLTQVTPGGTVAIIADDPKPSETFADGRTFLEWTGMNDDFGKPYLPQTLVKADNIRTAMALYGTMITSEADLYSVTNNLSGTYGLANDIQLSETWTSLHKYPNYLAFSGRLYGAGHSIETWDERMVFRTTRDSFFRGITFKGVLWGNTVGGIAKEVTGNVTVQDCTSDVWIVSETTEGDVNTQRTASTCGGFFGEVKSGTVTFERCTMNQRLFNCKGTYNGNSTGGFVGRFSGGSGIFIDCTSGASIATSSGSSVGGMVGQIGSGGTFSFLRCRATGNITGNYDLGGLIGVANSPVVCEDCEATGKVSGSYQSSDGGFIGGLESGAANSRFLNCRAAGDVANTYSGDGAGGFVGRVTSGVSNTTFANCNASGKIRTAGLAGGFVGVVYGQNTVFTNCVASGAITGRANLGGFVGVVTGAGSRFSDCEAGGNVALETRTNGNNNGGFAGQSGSSSAAITYEGCRALGGVSAAAGDYVGGFVGYVVGADSYRRCMSAGLVKGNTQVGGFGGRFYCAGVNVSECFAIGDVVGHNAVVGGFAGYVERTAAIIDSYSLGNVTGWNYPIGGFAANVAGSSLLKRCYTAGVVKGYGYQVGSFAGELGSSVTVADCAALTGGASPYPVGIVPVHAIGNRYTNTVEHAGVVELDAAAFKQRANFAAFHAMVEDDDSPVWAQAEGSSQPYLAWSAPDGNLSVYPVVYGADNGTISVDRERAPAGSNVMVTAHPKNERFFFAGWTGSAPYADATNAHTTLTLDNHRVATTQFGRYVYDAEELQAITNDLDGVFGLYRDIDLLELTVETEEGPQQIMWRPIGFPGNGYNLAFTGSFFGFGHSIENLVCTNSFAGGTGYVGLFGDVSFGTLDGVEVSGKVWGSQDVGGLVGRAKGSLITNCVARVEVTPLGTNLNGPFGGLVGDLDGTTVVGCRADGFVKGGGRVGGLVGDASDFCAIFNSAARGDVCGFGGGSGQCYGALVGLMSTPIGSSWSAAPEKSVVVSNCWCSGEVWGRSSAVGSFVGSGGHATTVLDCAIADGRTAKRRPGGTSESGGIGDFTCRILTAEKLAGLTNGWRAVPDRDFSKAVHISTAEELAAITNDLYGIYILDKDIDLKGTAWTPIGDNDHPFYGEFYGNGHMIRNLSVDGFFSSSVVRGGFFGCIGGRVNGLRVKGSVTVKSETSNDRCAGGFAGSIFSGAFVDDCSFRGDVTCWGDCAGGFSGRINDSAVVAGCCVTGAVRKVIVDNTNRGCGGFAGYMSPSSGGGVRIMDCYSLASVNSSPGESSGSGHSYAGGFIGRVDGTYTNNGKIETSYCSGSVTNAATYGGAFIGSIDRAVITNSYYDCDATTALAKGTGTTGKSEASPGITPLTHEAMLHAANFTPFDFANTWKIDEGETTPYLLALYVSKTGYELWLDENGIGGDPEPEEIGNGIPYGFRYAFDIPMAKGPGDFAPPMFHIAFGADGKPYVKLPEQVNDEGVTLEVLASTDLEDFGKEDTSEWSHRVVMRLDENGYYRPAEYLNDPTTYVWPNAMFFAWHLVVE